MLINHFLNNYDFNEKHSIKVKGIPQNVYPLLLNTNVGKPSLIRLLFKLRGLKGGVTRIKDIDKSGFIKLAEKPNEEILFGIATTSSTFSNCVEEISGEDFLSFSKAGSIRAVINFKTVQTSENTTVIFTETRVWCADNKTRNRFKIYWFFVSPFSRLIRNLVLLEIKKHVNRSETVRLQNRQ
jgi:hypothetical protein